MENALAAFIEICKRALDTPDPQSRVEIAMQEAVKDPAIVEAVSKRTKFARLEDMAIHRSEDLTVLAAALPPAFFAAPHNHNLWSVVGVCAGQEDNEFFKRDGAGLKRTGEKSVVGPGVLPNGQNVIHAVRNPLDTPLVALHVYGGDLFAVPRSNWDPKTHKEVAFDWQKVAQT